MVERLSAGGGRGFVEGRRSARAAAEVLDWEREVGEVGCGGDLWCGRGEERGGWEVRGREEGGGRGRFLWLGEG